MWVCLGLFLLFTAAAALSARGKSRVYQALVFFVVVTTLLFGLMAVATSVIR